MKKLEQLKQDNPRFQIQTWVADWGIYDIVAKRFIGVPIESFPEAEKVLLWYLTHLYENINSKELMEVAFLEWADEYFDRSKLNIEIVKIDIIDHIRRNSFFLKDITSNSFKTKLRIYCQIKGYSFNDRIMKMRENKTVEMICINTAEDL